MRGMVGEEGWLLSLSLPPSPSLLSLWLLDEEGESLAGWLWLLLLRPLFSCRVDDGTEGKRRGAGPSVGRCMGGWVAGGASTRTHTSITTTITLHPNKRTHAHTHINNNITPREKRARSPCRLPSHQAPRPPPHHPSPFPPSRRHRGHL